MRGMTFGEWFRAEREKRGWSQAWVARRVGVGRSQMNNIEAGRSRASAETLQALCALFDTTPAQMLEDMKREQRQTEAQPPPPIHHPGIEDLAADAELRTRYGVTAEELELLRQGIYPVVIRSKRTALELLLALRSALLEE